MKTGSSGEKDIKVALDFARSSLLCCQFPSGWEDESISSSSDLHRNREVLEKGLYFRSMSLFFHALKSE